MKLRVEATPAVELDVEAAFSWYEGEEPGLGFLVELRPAIKEFLITRSVITTSALAFVAR